MKSNNWQKKTFVFSFIATESLLLVISMTKPAFSSYFAFSRQYKSGLKQIQLSGKFKASDRDYNGEISATEIESFQGRILSYHQHRPEVVSLLDSIDLQEKLEFDRFKYNLITNHLEFSVRTRKHNLNPLTNSVESHWQVNFKQELDNFLANENRIIGIDSEGTGITQISKTVLWEVDSLMIMLILGLILFRVNQQIHSKSQPNQKSQELNLLKTSSSEN